VLTLCYRTATEVVDRRLADRTSHAPSRTGGRVRALVCPRSERRAHGSRRPAQRPGGCPPDRPDHTRIGARAPAPEASSSLKRPLATLRPCLPERRQSASITCMQIVPAARAGRLDACLGQGEKEPSGEASVADPCHPVDPPVKRRPRVRRLRFATTNWSASVSRCRRMLPREGNRTLGLRSRVLHQERDLQLLPGVRFCRQQESIQRHREDQPPPPLRCGTGV
jgi:hypothetical protein